MVGSVWAVGELSYFLMVSRAFYLMHPNGHYENSNFGPSVVAGLALEAGGVCMVLFARPKATKTQ